ncbi:MAG: helix-turn-helix domain-containing protein [Cytophagales bacterium]|nr:helix-turn-helix domain-containing protein [Cytophagales bacterium]
MSYLELQPNNKFSNLIDCYWTSKEPISGVHRVLPDGCADLIFNFGEAVINFSDNQISVGKESIAAVGMMTTYRDVFSQHGGDLLGIRFKSGCLSLLTNASLSELKNTTIQADEIIPAFNKVFLEKLYHTSGTEKRIVLIEKMLSHLLINSQITNDKLISSVTDLILQSKGQMRIGDIANSVCIGPRQLQRRFETRVGIGLKEYARVIRFINTSDTLKNAPQKSILEIAFENGYYDHAHLSNDFMHMAGFLPSTLR